MNVTLEPFVAEHGVEILGRSAEPLLDWLIKMEVCGNAYTGRVDDGRILGAAGVWIDPPQIGSAWVLPTPLVAQYPLAFHKTIRGMLDTIVQAHPRLEVLTGFTDPAYPERHAWMLRLGFVQTGENRSLWPEERVVKLYGKRVRNGHGT